METTKKFKPFDKVLVKILTDEKWTPDLYSYYDDIKKLHWSIGSGWASDENILPYEGNEHLVGTTDEPEEEEVRLKKGEFIIASDYIDGLSKGLGNTAIFSGIHLDRYIMAKDSNETYGYLFCIRFNEFDPNDMEATKAKILCVKNGEVIRYKG